MVQLHQSNLCHTNRKEARRVRSEDHKERPHSRTSASSELAKKKRKTFAGFKRIITFALLSSMKTFNESHLIALPLASSSQLDSLCNNGGQFVMEEIWKDIPSYEGFYQASTLGRIKRLSGIVKHSRGGTQKKQEQILTPIIVTKGYASVRLSMYGINRMLSIHRLIAITFYGHSECDVDHINHIRTDNRLSNLRYATRRENLCNRKINPSSGFIGVVKCGNQFRARITVNNILLSIGRYPTAQEASDAYEKYKSNLTNQ